MNDYTWPSVYFAYLFFAICFALAVFFFIRSWKDGYWSKQGEAIKYQIFDEPSGADTPVCRVQTHLDAFRPSTAPAQQEHPHVAR